MTHWTLKEYKQINMKPLDIYSQYPIELTKGKYTVVTDSEGKEYTDFYGGHGVISIGHSHPNFVKAITDQLDELQAMMK